MAYDGTKKKEESHRSVDDGLAPGRIQREKKRSYKDLLQEEDEKTTQVRALREKDSEFFPGSESHKKKRKHSSDEFCYRGKVVIKQGKGLTDHEFRERTLLNQCHQTLCLAFYRRRVHQDAFEQVIRNLKLISTSQQKIRELHFHSL
uniref:Uncharacterized protein n=1 Tax=Malurus cyaneus samueli TaxID=2593467 RepID=A0A8C5U688_9PASS